MATRKPKGLGRGLDALLGGAMHFDDAPTVPQAPTSLPVTALQAGKYQPRTRMDEGALAELAASIQSQGLLQAILVRPIEAASKGAPTYEIIAGERRFRAAKLAGLSEVPVLVKAVEDQAAAAMALIENIQRENLNPLEEAQGIHRLIADFGFTHEQAAGAVGRSRSAVSNLLRLMNLAKPVQIMLMAGDIDMGHARALLAVDAASQITLANQVVAKRMSVREAEKLVAQANSAQQEASSGQRQRTDKSRDIVQLEEELSDLLATRVNLKLGAKNKGQLQIDFASLDILDDILSRLRP